MNPIDRLPASAIRVPIVKQEASYGCGPAAVLSVLQYWLPVRYSTVDQNDLHAQLNCDKDTGCEPAPMVELFREAGLVPKLSMENTTFEDLEAAIARREPPIVCFQAWRSAGKPWSETWDYGHYAVVVDLDAENVYLSDPANICGPYASIPREEFGQRWHDLVWSEPEERANRTERIAIFVAAAKPRFMVEMETRPISADNGRGSNRRPVTGVILTNCQDESSSARQPRPQVARTTVSMERSAPQRR
jgi:predicted double-glycine peptidase